MSNDLLSSLLLEYDYKKQKAELDLYERKNTLFKKFPRLQEIEDEINYISINITKNILFNKDILKDSKNKIDSLKKEKNMILEKNNISRDYLQPHYECPICQDTGYINNRNKASVFCSCLKQKLLDISYNKSNISNLYKENFENFNPNIFSEKIDFEKYKLNISPRQNIINIKENCLNFIRNFDNIEYKNLLFTGNTGLGKTYLCNCIANELIKNGKTVLYQTAPILLDNVIDYKMNKYKKIYQNDFLKTVLESDLLIIDDLGTECLNSMKLSELFNILNARLLNLNNKVTKTIISTNLNINNIFNNYEERIGSRIVGYYDIYYFFGNDLRFRNKN